MANVNEKETQSTTSKLLTLANLARYNHSVCEKLGLTQDTLAYVKTPQENTDPKGPTTVAAALNDLYSKAAAAEKLNKTTTSTGGDYVTLTATAKTSSDGDGTLEFVVDDSSLDDTFVKKADVDITDTTVSNWGDSTTLKVDDKTLTITLPDNPIAGGATETKNGITVSIANGTAEPTLTVTPGSIATGDTSVVTGGAVYAAIEDAKAEDKYVTVDNQSITSEGGLISGTLAITSNKEGGSASLSVNPTLTTSSSDATAIATDKFVEETIAKSATTYSFGDNASFAKSGNTNVYTVTVPLMKSVGGEAATGADSIVLTLNAADFVKDGFLESVAYQKDSEGKDTDILVFTWNTDAGKTATEINLSKYIDIYTAGDGITIDDHTVSVNATGYLAASENGIDVNTSKLQGYEATGTTEDNNIATKKYVDDQVKAESITVDAEDVSAFGSKGSIEVKKAGASIGKFEVSLPSFTTPTTGNVKPSIDADGNITVATEEQGADNTTTYINTKLAQAGYVDEKTAEASEAYKGKTTLSVRDNTDIAQGDVVITLGGDGAAEDQIVTITNGFTETNQVLSSSAETGAFGVDQVITLTGVSGEDSNSTATIKIPALTAASGKSTSENVSVELTNGTITVSTNEQAGTGNYANDKALAQQGYVDERVDSIKVKDGENKTSDVADQQSTNGIYVTSSNGTFTVGAVVATDGEIDAIFDGTHTA